MTVQQVLAGGVVLYLGMYGCGPGWGEGGGWGGLWMRRGDEG